MVSIEVQIIMHEIKSTLEGLVFRNVASGAILCHGGVVSVHLCLCVVSACVSVVLVRVCVLVRGGGSSVFLSIFHF